MTLAAPAADLLQGIDLVVFDKDGTLIDFQRMWRGWVQALAADLEERIGRPFEAELLELMGVDPGTGVVHPHGLLAATPMARIREAVFAALLEARVSGPRAAIALAEAWHAPDPVALAHPVTDLVDLLGALQASGRRVAVVTSDDRGPTERTLRTLGVEQFVDAIACADDGRPSKPAPDGVHHVCAMTGVPAARTLVVGDAPADLQMGRNAGAGRVVGVLTGVGDAAVLAPLCDAVVPSIASLRPE